MVDSHRYQEANQVAYALANICVDLNCDFVLFMNPREAFASLYVEKVSANFLRLVVHQ